MDDRRVSAIRNNDKVGRGSDSFIEYYTDGEICRDLEGAGIKTEEDAVRWAIRVDESIRKRSH
tara:strand:+ start:785 stop:973 length:189 start_codon:yes stop_codon:yes gene_type:complete